MVFVPTKMYKNPTYEVLMKLILWAVFFLNLSCQHIKDSKTNSAFNAKIEQYFDKLWEFDPLFATVVGNHKFDDKIVIKDDEFYKNYVEFLQKSEVELSALNAKSLTSEEQVDLDLVLNQIRFQLWDIHEFKSFEWQPEIYNFGLLVSTVLEGTGKSEDEKLKALLARLRQIGPYYANAKKMIKKPSREHSELAISQNQSLISYLGVDVLKRYQSSGLDKADKDEALKNILIGKKAIASYVDFLKSTLNQKNLKNFRIGKEFYKKKFYFDLQSNRSPEELYSLALQTKKQVHAKMLELSLSLWPKYFPNLPSEKKGLNADGSINKKGLATIKKVISRLSQDHVKGNEFIDMVRAQIPKLENFIKSKDLLYLDPKKPLKVRPTPSYERGFAVASVDPAGFFDVDRETFYNVSPLEDMKPQEMESFLREYNNYTMQIINIHEGVPGHYVQLVYSNKNRSIAKTVLGNGSMIEGWAVYTERMMLEEGYGDNSPELWLMYYKWFLRAVCNTVLDYSIHNLNMTKAQALQLMQGEAFQEKTEAEGKWRRATYSQVQLASYFSGFSDIYELREKYKKSVGNKYSLKKFNETFLSFGSASVQSIQKMMNL